MLRFFKFREPLAAIAQRSCQGKVRSNKVPREMKTTIISKYYFIGRSEMKTIIIVNSKYYFIGWQKTILGEKSCKAAGHHHHRLSRTAALTAAAQDQS